MLVSPRVISRVALIAVTAAFALAGCGGGGSSPGSGAAPGGGSGIGTTSRALAPATVSVSFLQYQPVHATSTRRGPKFISPATESISIAVIEASGSTIPNPVSTTFNVGPTFPNCTTSGAQITCSASIDAPVGNDVIAINAYPQQNGAGTPLASNALAPITVLSNATNVIPLQLNGVIANLEMLLVRQSFTAGTAATSLVVLVPLDASGAVIVNPGNYSPSIAVTSSDTSGAFSLILDGSASGSAATVSSPNDQLVLSYSGTGSPTATTTLTATAGSATATVSAHVGTGGSSLGSTDGGAGFVPSAPNQFVFSTAGQVGTVIVSGGTAPYTIVSGNSTVASVSGTSPNFSITAGAVGTTSVTITDSASTPASFSIPVTVQAPAIAIAVNSCGSQATCATSGITFPQSPAGGPTVNETGTIALTGGTGTYTYYFAISGSTSSVYANVTQSGNLLTITPTGAGNDVLVIQSGSQSALYTITTGSPFAASLPAAEGLLVENGTGKNFSVTLPASVTSVTQTSGLTDNNLVFSPPVLTATPMTGGTGNWKMTDANGDIGNVPWTVFQLVFGTYAGPGASSATETFNAPGADEAFTGNGETDTVTLPSGVDGVGGTLSVVSSNPNLVSVSAVSNTSFTVTSAASGNGFAAITLTDSGTGASASYSVSVTTTTIPIASRNRR